MSLKQLKQNAYHEEDRADLQTLEPEFDGIAQRWYEAPDENNKSCIYLDVKDTATGKLITQKFSSYHFPKLVDAFTALKLDGFGALVNSGKAYHYKQMNFNMGFPRWIPVSEVKKA